MESEVCDLVSRKLGEAFFMPLSNNYIDGLLNILGNMGL